MVCILLWSSVVRVRDSQAYRKMDVTREGISCILELSEILLLFQTGFNLVNAAVVCAILESISGLEPWSVISEPRYLKLLTVASFCPFILISVLMPLVLFVISLVFSALTSMPLAVSVQSFMFQGETWCTDLGSRPSDQFRCNTIWDITPEPSRTAVRPYLGPCRPACNSLELCQTQSRRFTTEIGLMCCNDQWLVN